MHTFSITNHEFIGAANANRVVAYIATDVFTPESVGGISREMLASHLENLAIGETLTLKPFPFTGGRVQDTTRPVLVTRNA